MVDVTIDLLRDFTGLVAASLIAEGYASRPDEPLFELLLKRINLRERRLPQRCWQVRQSRELRSRELQRELRFGIRSIVAAAKTGKDLTPFLSTGVLAAEGPRSKDPMLYDWGIRHLHLGTNTDPLTGFVKRTGPLLFAMADPHTLYFIDVRPHGSWTDVDLLEIVNRNWRHLLDPYRLRGISSSSRDLSPSDRMKLRKVGCQALVDLSDGSILAPPGGGLNTAKGAVRHVMEADWVMQRLKWLENAARSSADQMIGAIKESRGSAPATLALALEQITEDQAILRELQTGMLFGIPTYA